MLLTSLARCHAIGSNRNTSAVDILDALRESRRFVVDEDSSMSGTPIN